MDKNISIPVVPGKNFLRVTGTFYIIAGGVSIISALLVRFIYLGRIINEVVPPLNGYLYTTALDVLPIWRLTAVNSVFAILEQVHFINPKIEPISALASRLPGMPMHDHYASYLRYPSWWFAEGIVLTFVAVIIGIFIVFMGIMAVKYCESSKRTKLLVILAMINFAAMLTSTIFLVSFFSVLGCVIAALYFLGAFLNYISYEKFYTKTDKTVYIKKIIKYVAITGASVLCITVLFSILIQLKTVRIINDSKFYLNGDTNNACIHIIDENYVQLINFDMDNLTQPFEERLGFTGDELEFIQKAYNGEIEFEFENNTISLILPRYKGYNIGFSVSFKNENTIFFGGEQYIKQ